MLYAKQAVSKLPFYETMMKSLQIDEHLHLIGHECKYNSFQEISYFSSTYHQLINITLFEQTD